jgi:hypothetical protein
LNELLARETFEADVRGMDAAHMAAHRRTCFALEYPLIDLGFDEPGRIPLRLQVHARNYDAQAPSIVLCAWDGTPFQNLPVAAGVFNGSQHPSTGRPFVCMPGVHEYHTHPSHLDVLWEQVRGRLRLPIVIYQIQEDWRDKWRQ